MVVILLALLDVQTEYLPLYNLRSLSVFVYMHVLYTSYHLHVDPGHYYLFSVAWQSPNQTLGMQSLV